MWPVRFCFDNIQSPQVAHDKQAQANAEHVKEPATKAKARRAQNGTRNCVFPILRAAQTSIHNFMQWDQLFAGKVANFITKLINTKACS